MGRVMAGDVATGDRAAGVRSPATTVRLGPALAAGLVVGLMTVINALAFASLIFHDTTPSALLPGISAVLLGAGVAAAVTALTSGQPGVIAAPLGSTAVAYILIAGLPARLPGFADDPMLRAQMAVVLCGLATLVAGIAFLLMGAFRLGSLARFLPYPVVSGFNAGAGWLFMIGGVSLANASSVGVPGLAALHDPATLVQAGACVVFGGLMVLGTRRMAATAFSWAVLPVLLAVAILGFNAVRVALGYDMAAAGAHGWLLGPFPAGHIWEPPSLDAVTGIPWHRLRPGLTAVISILLVGSTTVIMLISGMEVELNTSLDFNREMLSTGLANIATGMAGGVLGGPAVSNTILARRMGGTQRSVGLIAGLACVAVLVTGTGLLNDIPRFAVGALLVCAGAERLIERIWLERGRMPLHERGTVLLVLVAVIWFGYVEGVVVGLAITLVIFAWNYRRIPVVRVMATGLTHRSSVVRPAAAQAALRQAGGAIRLCRLQGYMFFLNATGLLRPLQEPGVRFVILDCAGVTGLDSSACLILRRMGQLAEDKGIVLMMTDLPAPIRATLHRQDLPTAWPNSLPPIANSDQALHYAEDVLLGEAGLAESAAPQSLAALMADTLKQPVSDAALSRYLERITLDSGAILVRQGDPADAMYYIENGSVSARLERADGSSFRIRTTTAGTIVGELGLFVGGRRTATVVAEAPCVAQRLSVEALARMEAEDVPLSNQFNRFLATLMADKLADNSRLLEQMMV
jgi:SulP family sulfate permease